MAVSAVETGLLARHRFPLEPRSTPTHTGDALCPFSKIQKQAAFGITPLRSGFRFAGLPTLGYTFDLPLGYALSRGCSLPLS